MNLCYLIFFILFLYNIEPSKIRTNFDEIFGDGWDEKEREEKATKIEQNEQNDQNNQNENSTVFLMGGELGNGPNNQKKRETIKKFEAIKDKLREKGKYKGKVQCKIERKIAKLLGTNRELIQKWKNELNLNKNKMKKRIYEQKKRNFIEQFDEFKELHAQRKQKEFVKELGISKHTFRKWKNELAPKYCKTRFSNEEKLEKLKKYYEIKERNKEITDRIIANKLGIGWTTLKKWKKDFHPLD